MLAFKKLCSARHRHLSISFGPDRKLSKKQRSRSPRWHNLELPGSPLGSMPNFQSKPSFLRAGESV